MGNCLVTKLPSSVNNDNLRKFGTLYVEFKNSSFNASAVLGLRFSSTATIKGVDSLLYQQNGTTIGSKYSFEASSSANWICSGGGVVEIFNKYDLKYFNANNQYLNPINAADLKYCTSLINLTTPVNGNLSDLPDAPLTTLNLSRAASSYDLFGELSDLAKFTSLSTLNIGKNEEITGELSDIGGLTSLTSLSLGDISGIGGTVEAFVAAQRAAGRTTCAGITAAYIGTTSVTFNGASIASASNTSISWDATTITVGGTTITA